MNRILMTKIILLMVFVTLPFIVAVFFYKEQFFQIVHPIAGIVIFVGVQYAVILIYYSLCMLHLQVVNRIANCFVTAIHTTQLFISAHFELFS